MSDKMREAFEKWLDQGNHCGCNENMWKAWQAAQSAAVPVVGDVVALLAEVPFRFLQKGMVTVVKPNKPEFIEEDDIALYRRPTTSITAAELDFMRQWFECVQDVNGGFLNHDDFILAKKLYEIIGMRVPHSIIDAAIAGEKNHG